MSEKLLLAHFRLFEQSDMFFEQIVPGVDGGVKFLSPSVGNHMVVGWLGNAGKCTVAMCRVAHSSSEDIELVF
jgi:hypothetical protein